MKLVILTVFATLLFFTQAQVSWYAADRNVTCEGHADGSIACNPGRIGDAPEVDMEAPKGDFTPAIKGRSPLELEKRVSCNIDGVTQGLACFTHCFALNYCNSHCDSDNICHCTCLDISTPAWLVCTTTTCK